MFQQLLREDSILVGLRAADHEAALKKMVERIPAWDLEGESKERLLQALLDRERFGTTAIGDGVALPRCHFSGVKYPVAFVGVSKEGISFPSLDGAPVYVIFLLVMPEESDMDHYEKKKILHSAEHFFRDRFLRERIKIAETSEEVYEVILREADFMKEEEVRHLALHA